MNGDFSWSPDEPPVLTEIQLDIAAGQLVAVVGSTGCGKSSLVSAALGYMHQVTGPAVTARGKVAYVPQVSSFPPWAGLEAGGKRAPHISPTTVVAWRSIGNFCMARAQAPFVMAGTVRANILFGQPYDESLYESCIRAAQLEADFAQLPGGDLTELGERGWGVGGAVTWLLVLDNPRLPERHELLPPASLKQELHGVRSGLSPFAQISQPWRRQLHCARCCR